MSNVWEKLVDFIGQLSGENISRSDYVTTPEYEEAEKKLQQEDEKWEGFLQNLQESDREMVENYIDCVENMALRREQRAYLQGCVDFAHIMNKLGILKGELFPDS